MRYLMIRETSLTTSLTFPVTDAGLLSFRFFPVGKKAFLIVPPLYSTHAPQSEVIQNTHNIATLPHRSKLNMSMNCPNYAGQSINSRIFRALKNPSSTIPTFLPSASSPASGASSIESGCKANNVRLNVRGLEFVLFSTSAPTELATDTAYLTRFLLSMMSAAQALPAAVETANKEILPPGES